MPHLQLINILRNDLHLQRQLVTVRDDEHDRIGRGHHAAHGMHGHFMHHAGLRRDDIDALQLIFGGDLALDEFPHLGLYLAQFPTDLGS
ncbi:hypothetical protein D3C86_1336130 [compost metagenome]